MPKRNNNKDNNQNASSMLTSSSKQQGTIYYPTNAATEEENDHVMHTMEEPPASPTAATATMNASTLNALNISGSSDDDESDDSFIIAPPDSTGSNNNNNISSSNSSTSSGQSPSADSNKLVVPARQRNRDFGSAAAEKGVTTVPHSKYTFSHETQQTGVLTPPSETAARLMEQQNQLLVPTSSSNIDNEVESPSSTISSIDSYGVATPSGLTADKLEREEEQQLLVSESTTVVQEKTAMDESSSSSSSSTVSATKKPMTSDASAEQRPKKQFVMDLQEQSSAKVHHHHHHQHHHYTTHLSGQEETKKKKTDDLLASICAFGEEKIDNEVIDLCLLLHECIQMRKKYILYDPNTDLLNITQYPWELPDVKEFNEPNHVYDHRKVGRHHQPPTPFDPFDTHVSDDSPLRTRETFEMRKGVFYVYDENDMSHTEEGSGSSGANKLGLFPPMVSFKEFYDDHKRISKIVFHAPTKSYCYNRLKTLELKNSLYKNINEALETHEQKQVPHRDFYNVRKVDTHIHLSASMTQKRLVKFIKRKLKECPNEVVIFRDGKELTLAQTFESLNLTAYDISVDTLDVHANKSILHRFDKFNLKYNPFGQSRLREIFLKTDNMIGGRYFAELCKETFQDLEDSRYQMSEPRVSIYGVNPNEWDLLGEWVLNNKMYSDHVRWLIQIPRLYYVHRGNNIIKNVQEMLDNVFRPLFEVTRDPKSHPNLHTFLKQVIGFDSVDDETKPEPRFHSRLPTPDQWNTLDNPPYAYYNYYFYANVNTLNQYRMSKGLNTFKYRPHCGEAGDPLHLISSYLVADNISHGIELRKTPVLQYLYYLHQIGLAVSPLSNNSLFLDYSRNPLPQFLCRGLNVSISTDDPLMFHLCRDPLLEEYSIGAQVWRLSNTDLCEMARNSVLMCGWDRIYKSYWLGDKYYLPGVLGNDIHKTNMPNIRVQYRYETLVDEHLFILKCVKLNDLSCVNKNEKVMTKQGVITYDELMRLIKRTKPLFLRSAERVENLSNIKTHKHYEILERNRGPAVATTIAPIQASSSKNKTQNNPRSVDEKVSGFDSWRGLALFAVPLLAALVFTSAKSL